MNVITVITEMITDITTLEYKAGLKEQLCTLRQLLTEITKHFKQFLVLFWPPIQIRIPKPVWHTSNVSMRQ